MRNGHFSLEGEVAILLILGNLRLHDTRDLILENELVLDGEALDARLVIPSVRVNNGSARPLLIGFELTVVVSLAVVIERQGQLRIGRWDGDLFGRRQRLHLIRRNVIR